MSDQWPIIDTSGCGVSTGALSGLSELSRQHQLLLLLGSCHLLENSKSCQKSVGLLVVVVVLRHSVLGLRLESSTQFVLIITQCIYTQPEPDRCRKLRVRYTVVDQSRVAVIIWDSDWWRQWRRGGCWRAGECGPGPPVALGPASTTHHQTERDPFQCSQCYATDRYCMLQVCVKNQTKIFSEIVGKIFQPSQGCLWH